MARDEAPKNAQQKRGLLAILVIIVNSQASVGLPNYLQVRKSTTGLLNKLIQLRKKQSIIAWLLSLVSELNWSAAR